MQKIVHLNGTGQKCSYERCVPISSVPIRRVDCICKSNLTDKADAAPWHHDAVIILDWICVHRQQAISTQDCTCNYDVERITNLWTVLFDDSKSFLSFWIIDLQTMTTCAHKLHHKTKHEHVICGHLYCHSELLSGAYQMEKTAAANWHRNCVRPSQLLALISSSW